MSQATIVRYTAKPESAEENKRLIRAVFEELAEKRPGGLRYSSVCLDDGVSFVHTAELPDGPNPLTQLASFQAFTADIGSRCEEGPVVTNGTVVGTYVG